MIIVTVMGSGLAQMEEATRVLGSAAKAGTAFARAINHTGDIIRTEAGRALSDQTGLPKRTAAKAYRRGGDRAKPSSLMYVINGSGGNISLKYFQPRETFAGVSAAPHNSRAIYVGTFMKAGFWPERVAKPQWNGQVFMRLGDGHSYNGLKSKGATRSGTKFQKVRSGVFIPTEMVTGRAADAWNKGARLLAPRIDHEIRQITKGVVS